MSITEGAPTQEELANVWRSVWPRPGWRARNIDADSGRVYDCETFRAEQALVEWDWDVQRATGYLRGERVYDGRGRDMDDVQLVMGEVEAIIAARWDELTGGSAA
jgi:hypothetical protein